VLVLSLPQVSVAAGPALPQHETVRSDFGPIDGRFGFGAYEPQTSPCLSPEQRSEIQARIDASVAALGPLPPFPGEPLPAVYFDWPLEAVGSAAQGFGVHGIANFVDQDPAFPDSLLDWGCGERTYDLPNGYNHSGVDIFTWPLPWTWMDADEVRVVAAAPGRIVLKSDGHFDESCGFNGSTWNAVYVRHADGSVAWYGHLKRHSLTAKTVGQRVSAGEYLGVVGSSGSSSGPHLHLELRDASNALIEPYAGPCNALGARTWWRAQRPYFDSAVNRLMIGTAPISYPACPGREVTQETATLAQGAVGYFTAFYRDQLGSQTSLYEILRPNGTTFRSWSHSPSATHYSASYWWWSWVMPAQAPAGTWTFRVTHAGRVYTKTFTVS
jgi:murein DD-endopeptidase MepM/ murein hydrolase activator NlpD